MKVLCKCGCGHEINKSGNEYIHGHNRRNLASYTYGDRWSMKYDQCQNCGTNKLPYGGKGLCVRCYSRELHSIRKLCLGKWAINHDYCIDCGRIDRPHQANGLCGTCYSNNENRKKGVKKRNIGAWSWYYDKCKSCETTEVAHAWKGLCRDCYGELNRDLSNDYEICPVCGVKVNKLSQHLSMKARKCKKHAEYQYKLFKQYFDSDLGLDDISKELNGVDRHTITKRFIKFFGKKETTKRNQAVKSCLCSARAKIGFNSKNRFGTVVYYDSLNNGKVRFRSKLEEKYAKSLDKSGVKWFYEYKSFPYIDSNGKRRTYTPDFYLVDSDKYIEVKGYEKEDDQYKIDCLKNNGINIEMVKEIT